jgi:hypothetical protein
MHRSSEKLVLTGVVFATSVGDGLVSVGGTVGGGVGVSVLLSTSSVFAKVTVAVISAPEVAVVVVATSVAVLGSGVGV